MLVGGVTFAVPAFEDSASRAEHYIFEEWSRLRKREPLLSTPIHAVRNGWRPQRTLNVLRKGVQIGDEEGKTIARNRK
jgi:hypothetical protein